MPNCPIEDRLAMQDQMIAYAHAVDSMHDVDGICAVFTEDAIFDLTRIGLTEHHGHAGIRALFESVFASMSHHGHYLSNFAVTAYAGDRASMRAYVDAKGLGKDGSSLNVLGRYYFDFRRTGDGWKAERYTLDLLLPPAGSLDKIRA